MMGSQTQGLDYLLEQARRVKMTAAEVTEQRVSFAYGNAAFENELITREMIEEEEKKISAAK